MFIEHSSNGGHLDRQIMGQRFGDENEIVPR